MDISNARRIAQAYVGTSKALTSCWNIPDGIYATSPEGNLSLDTHFVFGIVDEKRLRVGGGQHVAVSKASGGVLDMGFVGE